VTNYPVSQAEEIPVAMILEGMVTTTAENITSMKNSIKWRIERELMSES